MRKPIVAANWKMNKSIGEAVDVASELKGTLSVADRVETVVCPPYTALKPVGDMLMYSPLGLGAQDVHPEPNGAFTGSISASMLRDLGCQYVICGHSERRQFSGEDDALIARKLQAIVDAGMRPILCIGETLEQRESGQAQQVVERQLRGALQGEAADYEHLVVAYEPVWAIGTGQTASPEEIQAAHAFIRRLVTELCGAAIGDALRIQYGGSVKPENAREIFAQADVDGGLIGGASLRADPFIQIVQAALGPDDEA